MMGDELKLEHENCPEPIIQHIQSFLPGKEAALTTILSKSWHSAWLTRPNIELDESNFKYREFPRFSSALCEFSNHANKTIKRYEQSNLKIESFKLCMSSTYSNAARLANKLIAKAVGKLGATRLSFQIRTNIPRGFLFPCEVVFGSDNLVELSLEGCAFYLDGIDVKCCRLESLCLDMVDTDTVSKIILSCPLIKKLSLSNIRIHSRYAREERAPFPRSAATATCHLRRLKCLVLCYLSFITFFPGDLLSKFPFLVDFTLNEKHWYFGDVQISNCSLERINIHLEKKEKDLKVRLDVPNIRKFTFEGGDSIPKLSFVSSTTTREWESHVSIVRYGDGGPNALWFGELNELLTVLRHSKIHLSLHVKCGVAFDYRVGDLSFTRKHKLESLTIDMTGLPSSSFYALFDGLFRLCRPKLVIPKEELVPGRETNIDLLWHALDEGMHVSNPKQIMYGLNDLEETNAQVFGGDVIGWRAPIPLKSLLLEDIANLQRVRLLLKWKPLHPAK